VTSEVERRTVPYLTPVRSLVISYGEIVREPLDTSDAHSSDFLIRIVVKEATCFLKCGRDCGF